MECFGVNGGGGLEFNYGDNYLALLIDLIQELDPNVCQDVYKRAELPFKGVRVRVRGEGEGLPLASPSP